MTTAPKQLTYETPPLHLGGITVAFSEVLTGKNLVQRVTALLLTWVTLRDTHHLQLQALEAMGVVPEPKDWYDVAKEQYESYLAELLSGKELFSQYIRLKREYFNDHRVSRPVEMKLLIAALNQRATNVNAQANFSY